MEKNDQQKKALQEIDELIKKIDSVLESNLPNSNKEYLESRKETLVELKEGFMLDFGRFTNSTQRFMQEVDDDMYMDLPLVQDGKNSVEDTKHLLIRLLRIITQLVKMDSRILEYFADYCDNKAMEEAEVSPESYKGQVPKVTSNQPEEEEEPQIIDDDEEDEDDELVIPDDIKELEEEHEKNK